MRDVLFALLIGGLMGLIGQAVRAGVGLKKLSDDANASGSSASDLFDTVRFVVSLIIGTIAGMIGAITIGLDKVAAVTTKNTDVLLALATVGYAGADAIEAFAVRLTGAQLPPAPNNVPAPNAEVLEQKHLVAPLPAPPAKPNTQTADWRANMAIALGYRDAINQASQSYDMSPSLICAIGWRESGWGQSNLMKPKGPGGTGDWAPRKGAVRMPPDNLGWGRGLMQIDYGSHTAFCSNDTEWKDPTKNIMFGCSIYDEYGDSIRKNFPAIASDEFLRANIASYNAGAGNVMKALKAERDVSTVTYSPGYVDDIVNAMSWFQAQNFDAQILSNVLAPG